VLTLNPVNTTTWAELSKSFAKNHELTIDMEKAMDIGAAAAINKQSLEGDCVPVDGEPGEPAKWIKLFREFVKGCLISKSLRNEFVASPPSVVGMTAYTYALDTGLDNEDAYEFASYISDRHEVLKSLFGTTNFGGGTMAKISSLLDADLEELQKSFDNEDNEDEGKDKKKKKDDEDDDEGSEDDNKGNEGDNEDDDKEKSLTPDFAKSFAAEDGNAQALDVSEFLSNLVDEVGYSMDGFAKSMTHVTKQNNVIAKALTSVCELVQSLSDKVEDLQTENGDLQKSLNDVLNMPVGRKSVVSGKEVVTLQKSLNADRTPLNRAQVGDILMKSFDAGEIPGSTVSRFEAGVNLSQLSLPKSVTDKLGL